MEKNGHMFIAVINRKELSNSWNPYSYRKSDTSSLSDFVKVVKVRSNEDSVSTSIFSPIEYSHIPIGKHFTFVLNEHDAEQKCRTNSVGEGTLLFGTMRAYLGNVIVTPNSKWIGHHGPLHFPVKSEFVEIKPKDELIYFWWGYFQSPSFLKNLPTGSGGTRPRLHPDVLLRVPVDVPSLETRKKINDSLEKIAKQEWESYIEKKRLLMPISH